MAVGLVAGGLSPSPATAQPAPPGLLPPGDWSPSQVDYMLDLIDATEEHLPSFSNNGRLDTQLLRDLGFTRFIATAPGGYDHWTNSDWIDDEHILNPEYPESLVFRNTNQGWVLEAAMYYVPRQYNMNTIPEEIAWLPGWHNHPELGIPTPMMHVWIADNRCGHRFAGLGVTGLNCNVYGDPHGHGPPPGSGEYPYGQDVTAELEGFIAVDAVDTGFGPGGTAVFPMGGEGVCNPAGAPTTLTGSFSESHGGHATFTGVETTAEPADLLVTDDGAICGTVALDLGDGEMVPDDEGTASFSITDVTAELEIAGAGIFEAIIPAGCSLSLDIGELTGTIAENGPPSTATLSASEVSVAAAPASCGAYGVLLDLVLALPSTNAEIGFSMTVAWDGEGGGHDH